MSLSLREHRVKWKADKKKFSQKKTNCFNKKLAHGCMQRALKVSSRDRKAFPEDLACELRLEFMKLGGNGEY